MHKLTADGRGSAPEQLKVSNKVEPRIVHVSATGMSKANPVVLTMAELSQGCFGAQGPRRTS
jgi:hypothetical protein